MSMTPSQDKRIELKYVLDEQLAQKVKTWARERLGRDPHCCESLVDSYDVHTLYLDTPEWDLYHRSGVAGSTKHRVRRYSHEDTLWLECKRKKKNIVHKHRTAVPQLEVIERLCSEPSLDNSNWCGDWFLKRVTERSLRPAVQVHYRRFARTSTLDGENLRLTIDSHLQASPVSDWDESLVSRRTNGELQRDVSAVQILELKFHNHMPWLFKELLKEFALPASGFSKFRSAVKCCQLVDIPEQSQSDSPSPLLNHQSRRDCGAGPVVDMTDEPACSYALGERLSDL